jgi:hypothetical protein
MLFVGAGLSAILHVLLWAIAQLTLLGSILKFVAWPGLITAVVLNSLLRADIAVPPNSLKRKASEDAFLFLSYKAVCRLLKSVADA